MDAASSERGSSCPAPQQKFTIGAGPVAVHERVSLALARAPLDHEDPEFQDLFRQTTDMLKRVFRTQQDTVIMQGEAVLGLEAAAPNLVEPGDKCLNQVSGVYGAGYGRHFAAYGAPLVEVAVPYIEAIDVDVVEEVLRREGDARVMAVVHCETPSGTMNPVRELARRHGALLVVEVVSSLGASLPEFDAWGETSPSPSRISASTVCLGRRS